VKVRIGPVEREIELSLVDRGRMIFRMLIGRRALAHAFLVDPGRRYVLYPPSSHHSTPPKPAAKVAAKPALKASPPKHAKVAGAKAPRGRERLG